MKRVVCLLALSGLLAAQQALALPVETARYAGYYQIPGGEFNVKLGPGATASDVATFNAIYNNYASVAQLNGGFETFCLDTGVPNLGNPKDAVIDPSGIAAGTAWLYEQFAVGTLAGYNYTPGVLREASAYALQNAIWALQGMVPWHYDQSAADVFLLSSAFTTQFSSLASAQTLVVGNVAALRMTYTDQAGNHLSQPMLALVPDGATTMMLLGMSMLGIGYTRRLLAK